MFCFVLFLFVFNFLCTLFSKLSQTRIQIFLSILVMLWLLYRRCIPQRARAWAMTRQKKGISGGKKRGCYSWLTDGWKRSGIGWLGLVSSPHSAFSCKFEGSENGAPAENASAWRNLVIKLMNWCYLLLSSVVFWHRTVLKVIKLSDCHTVCPASLQYCQ